MKMFDNNVFETYKSEVQDRWGTTDAYKEHIEKTKNYSKDTWNGLTADLDHIFAAFAACMETGAASDAEEPQHLVKKLQHHITQNYYNCTAEILFGLGQMYVADERFKHNIDKHADGTAAFACAAITHYCKK